MGGRSCNVSFCAKTTLIILNMLIMACGAALTGVGLWLIVAPDITILYKFINVAMSMELLNYSAYLLIALGSLIVVVGMMGLIGAAIESKCVLITYIIILVFIILGEIAAAVLVYFFQKEINGKLSKSFQEQIMTANYSGTDDFYALVNLVQSKFECCGYNGTKDYIDAQFKSKYGIDFPYSCCTLKNGTNPAAIITKTDVQWNNCYNQYALKVLKIGCERAVTQYAEEHVYLLMGLALGICLVQIFPIILSCLLIRTTDK